MCSRSADGASSSQEPHRKGGFGGPETPRGMAGAWEERPVMCTTFLTTLGSNEYLTT